MVLRTTSPLDRFSRDDILSYLDRLADTLVLMEAGRVRAAGPIAALLADPALPLIHMPQPAVVIDGEVVSTEPRHGLSGIAVPGDLGPLQGRRPRRKRTGAGTYVPAAARNSRPPAERGVIRAAAALDSPPRRAGRRTA